MFCTVPVVVGGRVGEVVEAERVLAGVRGEERGEGEEGKVGKKGRHGEVKCVDVWTCSASGWLH